MVTATRPNGKVYTRRAEPVASVFTTFDDMAAVVVVRTHDVAEAEAASVSARAECELDGVEPRLTWWRLVPWDTGTGCDSSWVEDQARGVPCVVWEPSW